MNEDNPSNKKKNNFKKYYLSLLNKLFNNKPKNRDDLKKIINNYKQNNLIDPDTCEMLEGVMDISNQRVRDIMIPRSQIITLKQNQTIDEFLDIIIDSAHSRFPVISEDKDHIEGILIAKDLLQFIRTNSQTFDISKILHKAIVIPESKKIDKLLKEFRSQRYHMAIVIDEFGSVSGLVTIEDILELIVGEIKDEYDNQDNIKINIKQINSNSYSVHALTQIENFNKTFGSNFNNKEVDTIGGLVMQAFGHLPKRNEIIIINNYQFKIAAVDNRKIILLHIKISENTKIPKL